jgi:hypothetical protein
MNVTDSEGNRLELDAHIERNYLRQGISLHLYGVKPYGSDQDVYRLPAQLTMIKDNAYNPSQELRESFLFMPESVAQQLLDELYVAGYRPSNVQHATDTVKALNAEVSHGRQMQEKLLSLIDKVVTHDRTG